MIEREVERRLHVRSTEYLGHRERVTQESADGKQQEVGSEEGDDQRHLVDPLCDKHARRNQDDLGERRKVGQGAPPALAGMEHIETGDNRQSRGIENVGRRASGRRTC